MGAKKIQPTEMESALALVEPFVCADPARTHMNSAFHCGLWGRPFVCATDGHTAAIVHCVGEVKRPAGADRAPPMDAIMPANADRVGTLNASDLEALRELPRAWEARVTFRPGSLPTLAALREKGPKKHREIIWIVKDAALAFANSLDVTTAMSVGYLLRAIDFCGVELVTVWRERVDNFAPLLFTAGIKTYTESDRVAIVMPCRT